MFISFKNLSRYLFVYLTFKQKVIFVFYFSLTYIAPSFFSWEGLHFSSDFVSYSVISADFYLKSMCTTPEFCDSALMCQSVPTGYISPRQSPGKSFERANLGHSGNFLSNSPALGQKMMIEFPEVGLNFPRVEETAPQA